MGSSRLKALLYVSCATQGLDQQALEEIREVACERNAADGITGALMYVAGNFAQYIEGPSLAIDQLWGRLHMDRRHHSLSAIFNCTTPVRLFGRWHMAWYSPRTDGPVEQWISQTAEEDDALSLEQRFVLKYLPEFVQSNSSTSYGISSLQ